MRKQKAQDNGQFLLWGGQRDFLASLFQAAKDHNLDS